MSSNASAFTPSDKLSVVTPSFACKTVAASRDSKNFHYSNPNPQAQASKYKSIKEVGYSKRLSDMEKERLDNFKFGKK